MSATNDLQSCLVLIWNTALFHAGNFWGNLRFDDKAFNISLRLEEKFALKIQLRRHAGDVFILYEILLDRSYFIPEYLLPPEKVRTVLDCGANIGITSLYFASRYPEATIISIEPHPENFELLKRNVRSEPRIIPVNAAVTANPCGSVAFSVDRPAWGNKILENSAGITVPATTISDLCKTYNIEQIDLLKIDIEGDEIELFTNGEFLNYVRFGVIELHPPYTHREFEAELNKWGFMILTDAESCGMRVRAFARQLTLNESSFS